MTRDATIFYIDDRRHQALQDAENGVGCFSDDGTWAIVKQEQRIYVVSVSDTVDAIMVSTYQAVPLGPSDLYILALKQAPYHISLGDKDLTIFLAFQEPTPK
jgi:hypothetical protein